MSKPLRVPINRIVSPMDDLHSLPGAADSIPPRGCLNRMPPFDLSCTHARESRAMIGIGGHLPFLLIWIASVVYWIVAIVEVAQTPGWQFKAVGSDKTAWVLIVVLLGIIGALIWLFAKRSAVKAAAHAIPPPPP